MFFSYPVGVDPTVQQYVISVQSPHMAIPASSLTCHTATGTYMPYGITQCYLPPDRGDVPAFNQAEAGTRLSDPEGMQG